MLARLVTPSVKVIPRPQHLAEGLRRVLVAVLAGVEEGFPAEDRRVGREVADQSFRWLHS
jgi:hypothetical protein